MCSPRDKASIYIYYHHQSVMSKLHCYKCVISVQVSLTRAYETHTHTHTQTGGFGGVVGRESVVVIGIEKERTREVM